jgi:hypothetical protein
MVVKELLSICPRAIAISAFTAAAALSQTPATEIRVRLESADGLPVSGALVGLVKGAGDVVVEGISSQQGVRTLRAPPGTYRIRVRRIGYRPFLSNEIAIPQTSELVLRVESLRVSLAAVVVAGRGDCKPVSPEDESLGVVWEEIAKALRASQVTIEDLKGIARAIKYRDRLSLDGAVLSSDTTSFVVTGSRPFGALPPSILASEGYVRGDPSRGWEYFGADETVLLSNAFAESHCFRLVVDKDRAGDIGVAFEPLPKRKVADIAGVMWVDRRSSELREITFRYVNAGLFTRFDAGGFTRFRRLPSGAWIVSEWRLTVPTLEMRENAFPKVIQIGYVQNGGSILVAERPTVSLGRMATVTGVVYDSVAQLPLSDANVFLRNRSTTSDERGRFSLPNIPGGSGIVSFTHPALYAFGVVALQRDVPIRPDTTEVILATPSLQTIWRQMCPDSSTNEFRPRRGILHGFVRQPNGDPATSAVVEISWTERPAKTGLAATTARLGLKVLTDTEGHYAACGFGPLSAGGVVASREKTRSARTEFDFEGSLLLRRDLQVRF